jgi:hypothetical protein
MEKRMNKNTDAELLDIKKQYEALTRLKKNKDFQYIVNELYIRDGIFETTMNEDLDSQSSIDELKSRKLFNKFINDIIIKYYKYNKGD